MIVAGVMSGTSADGVDVALVRVEDSTSKRNDSDIAQRGQECARHTTFALLGHAAFPYSAAVRKAVLAAMNSECAGVADLARLNFLLGELYSEAVLAAQKRLRLKAELVGCHGQTIYHQGSPARFLGRRLAVTWQTGEGAVLAARLGVPAVTDFRPADMAAGGKGAPLVPYLDYLLYRDSTVGRIALNIGGIANVTAIPAGATPAVVAFDTGPGNMVMDTLAQQLFGQHYDRDGKIAAAGRVLDDVISRFLRESFFLHKPPKTAGREEFGREFVAKFLRGCTESASSKTSNRQVRNSTKLMSKTAKRDILATATSFTSRSIADGLRRYVLPRGSYSELIVSGGGARNRTLMAGLNDEAAHLNLRLRSSDEFGIPSEAKEAVAFAMLAFETWNRRPSNVPAATGATRPAVLGKISYP